MLPGNKIEELYNVVKEEYAARVTAQENPNETFYVNPHGTCDYDLKHN